MAFVDQMTTEGGARQSTFNWKKKMAADQTRVCSHRSRRLRLRFWVKPAKAPPSCRRFHTSSSWSRTSFSTQVPQVQHEDRVPVVDLQPGSRAPGSKLVLRTSGWRPGEHLEKAAKPPNVTYKVLGEFQLLVTCWSPAGHLLGRL